MGNYHILYYDLRRKTDQIFWS